MPLRDWLASLAVVVAIAGGARDARAASFEVSPTTLALSQSVTSTMITVTNVGAAEARFQVEAFVWDQLPNGQTQLTPTTDVLFFPSMLKLGPKESRKVRVGLNATAGPAEKTYRLLISEMPALATLSGDTSALKVLTKMNVPLFVSPMGAAAAPVARVEKLLVDASKLKFTLKNSGNSHFMAQKVRIVAKGPEGQPVWTQESRGWYILAGGAREYEIDLPKEACGAKSISLEVTTDLAKTVTGELASPRCSPGKT